MRAVIMALTLPLAACGGAGGGVASIGSTVSEGGTGNPTPSPTPTPGASLPSPAPTPTPTPTAQTNLFDVTTATTFDAVGALHSLSLDADGSSLYQGNASTAAEPSGTISYDPRDGVFVMKLADTKAGISRDITFQDPRHRTTGDAPRVDRQVPLLPGFNYLRVLDGNAALTFFYQRPNSSGSFVSLAGFERNENLDAGASLSEQGVLVFGARTLNAQTPTRGAARFDGQFLATMIAQRNGSEPVQQWLNGTSAVDVDFAARTLSLNLSGTVGPVFFQNEAIADSLLSIPSGSIFTAAGTAAWTATSNAFAGRFASASFTIGGNTTAIDFAPVSAGTTSAGASSIDGAFFGPDARDVGGNFRIVGGIPNQRVDILGGFVGTKK